jgi:hypothetical protein
MDIKPRTAVRLLFANASFPQVYYEAVANSLDAAATEVKIRVAFSGQIAEPTQVEISIWDDGDGFTAERFEQFKSIQEPKDEYHKGLGRLAFLHYFSEVRISSVYGDEKRAFVFSESFDGTSQVTKKKKTDKKGTLLEFRGFIGKRLHAADNIRPGAIKQQLLEQFLPLLHEYRRKRRAVQIHIELATESELKQHQLLPASTVLTVGDVPDFTTKTVKSLALHAFATIDIHYAILRDQAKANHLTAVSIDGRAVPVKLFGQKSLPAGVTALFLFESKLFTGLSDGARQRLVLPDTIPEAKLLKFLADEVTAILEECLPEISARNEATKQAFEEKYPHLIG